MSRKRMIAKWTGFVLMVIGFVMLIYIIKGQSDVIKEQVQIKNTCLVEKEYIINACLQKGNINDK